MSESLKNKTIKGASWSFLDNIANQGISFLVGLVLARLLSPEEYGLIGIIMIFIAVFNSIVDSGFSNSLIRKNNATDKDYNTAFITNMVVSLTLFIVLYFCAPTIANFFAQPELINLSRVMGTVVIINAFAIVQRTILVKLIDFKTQTKISLISSITSGVIGIGMALKGFGIWALVGQQISRQLLNTAFLWIYAQWYPKIQFSIESFKELFGFGWKLLVSGLINTIWDQSYQIIIGKFYTPQTLGQYTRANQFSSIFSSNITSVVQRVTYPVLSSIQNEKERLVKGYRRVIKTTMFVAFTCMLGLAGIAEPMVKVLVGEQWLPCVPLLQIICFNMMLYPLHAINLNILQVQGRSDLFLKLEILKKAIAVIPLILGIFIDIYWMLWGSVITGFIAFFINTYYTGKFLNYSAIQQIKDIALSFIIAFIMFLIVWAISFINLPALPILLMQLVIGFCLIISMSEIFKLPEYLEIKNIVLTVLNKK